MSDALTIYVYRRENGWESDIWRDGDQLGGCTAPTLAGCIDTTHEIIADSDPQWADFDANEDSRKRHMYQEKHSKNAEIVEPPIVMSNKTTYDELLNKVDRAGQTSAYVALRAVVELHKPQFSMFDDIECAACSESEISFIYPCATIQAIEKELA